MINILHTINREDARVAFKIGLLKIIFKQDFYSLSKFKIFMPACYLPSGHNRWDHTYPKLF